MSLFGGIFGNNGIMGTVLSPLFGSGSTPKAPKARNLGSEISSILAQGPALLQSQQNLAPGFNNLSLQTLGSYLNGTAQNPGALSIYANDILPTVNNADIAAQTAGNTALRTGLVDSLGSLGPGYTAAIQKLDPATTALFSQLQQQAGEGLSAENLMTPDQLASLNNELRSSQGARGMSYGPAASYAEVLANSQYGDALKQQRQNFAGDVVQAGNRMYQLPSLAAMGVQGPSGNNGMAFLGGAGNATSNAGNVFNTLGGYASDLFNTNYNAKASANIAAANNNASMMGSLFGLGGALGGAAIARG